MTDTVLEVQVLMSEVNFDLVKKVQDLMSQKAKRAVSLEEVISELTKGYLEKNDPVQKTERREKRLEKKMAT